MAEEKKSLKSIVNSKRLFIFAVESTKTIVNMLHFKGRATFKCKQCGHKFEAFDTEGGIIAGPNLPPCPKCGSSDTRKANIIDKIL